MDTEILNEKEWSNPQNWHMGILGLYHSKLDKRLIVPRWRPAFGWTFNFGHRYIGPVLAGLFMLPVVAVAFDVLIRN